MAGRPPRVAEWLLALVAPRGHREALLGDLAEEYADRVAGGEGVIRAAWWYWRQVLRSVVPLVVHRVVGRVVYRSGAGRLWRRLRTGSRSGTRSRGDGAMGSVWQDVRYGCRTHARSLGFSALVVATLGLGIGANTVIYSVVDGVVLNPFPFPEPERLVGVGTVYPKLGGELGFWENLSTHEYLDVLSQSRTLERVVAWDMGNRQIAGADAPERVFSAFWWGEAFGTLGMAPALGRGFHPDEQARGERVAVISHRLWLTRFGGDSSLVGRPLQVNGEPYTVVGVMPAGALVYGTDLWLPMPIDPERFPRGRRQFQVLARLAPGVTLAQANAELETIARRVESEHGAEHEEYAGWRLEAMPWTEVNVRVLKPAALVLVGAVGFVLLLVCVNVAGLLAARSARRRREMAVRAALGASRRRIVRQLLTESVVLAVLGGAVGVGVAVFGAEGVSRLIAGFTLPVPGQVALSGGALGLTALVSVGAGILFGLLPALQATRPDVQAVLKSEGPGATLTAGRHRLQRMFLAAEVALAVVLLVGGGLLINSFVRLQRVDPGFDAGDVLTMRLTLPWETYEGEEITRFFERLAEGVEAIPGVREAAAGSQFAPIQFRRTQVRIDGGAAASEGGLPSSFATIVSHDYFRTLGIPLLRGRGFEEGDLPGTPLVGVVNEAFVRRYFPGQDPIGRRIRLGDDGSDGPVMEIVGVAGSVRNRGLDSPPEPELFGSLVQVAGLTNQLFLLVRTEVPPHSVLPAIREVVRTLDPDQPIYAVQTVEDAFAVQAAPRRIATAALTGFALFALLLACIGIYSMAAYAVADRTQEIGVRIALGAGQAEVRRLVLRQALLPAAAGATVGLAVALGLGRLLGGLLFEISGTDPATIAVVAAVLAGVAILASYVPARRASRLDPIRALRRG